MNAILKRRMAATQQASELQASDEAYQQIFQRAPPSAPSEICDLPLDKLDSFFTADIGFKPYSPAKLEAFAQQLKGFWSVSSSVTFHNLTVMRS